jgi:hypothetical protein
MFGLGKPNLPTSEEERVWLDASFQRLARLLGRRTLLEAKVMLPIPECFPDPYDASEAAMLRLFGRVADAMQIDPLSVDVGVFDNSIPDASRLLPFYSAKSDGAGGVYLHDPTQRPRIGVNADQLRDPMALVATLAHELGHIMLLRPGLVERDEPDMEPLNDLVVVFMGLGVFAANSAFRFEQHTSYDRQGWSTKRLGYLSEELFGYALARFALERGELKPAWASYVSSNVAPYLHRSLAWLKANGATPLLSHSESPAARTRASDSP